MATAPQCLAGGLLDRANESCLLSPLSIPTPLKPILSHVGQPSTSTTYYVLPTPLFLLGITLLFLSLFISHKLSKTPIEQLGHIGTRGRKYFSWNETLTGDCGGRFIDWWIFGGSVWARAFLCIRDIMSGDGVNNYGNEEGKCDSNDAGGENLFACFGVATHHVSSPAKKDEANDNHDKSDHKNIASKKHCTASSVGVFGYDSSLGAHGPLILAPLRASVMLLIWSSMCTFMVMTHKELVRWMGDMDAMPSAPHNEVMIALALYTVQGIQTIMNFGEAVMHTQSTIVYATAFITLVEISLFVLGKVCTTLQIYVPRGVSHPGGPRPHKIARMPKWEEGKQHFLPNNLLQFRCAVAHDSHRDTESKPRIQTKLTGEPFGRQIWTPLRVLPSKGNVETEDDLEATLRKEFQPAASKSQQNGSTNGHKDQNILSPLMGIFSPEKKDGEKKHHVVGDLVHNVISTKDNILLREGKTDVIGDFVQNLLSPNKKKEEEENQKRKDATIKLVRSLASGGRTPLAFDPSSNVNTSDQLFRGQMIASYLEKNGGKLPEDISYMQQQSAEGDTESNNSPKTVKEAAKRGIAFYSMLQTTDGHFAGDYGGPHFLLPGLVVAWYVMGCPPMIISPPQQALMLYYLKVHQQEDGGWGTHIESPSTMFGTVMSYLAARLLGADKDLDWIKKGRDFIQKEGGAVMTSSWAKFWLCLVGCMDWQGELRY